MNQNFLLGLLGVLLLLLIGFGAYLFLRPAATAPVTNGTGNPFPGSGNQGSSGVGTGTSSPSGGSGGTLPITLSNGSTVTVPDFTKENQPAGSGGMNGYLVAGGDGSDFIIQYFPDGSGFDIVLLKEPIGQARLDAEAALRAKLDLPDPELCGLNHQVVTTIHVNDQYSGHDLGLSFCSGATPLPN